MSALGRVTAALGAAYLENTLCVGKYQFRFLAGQG